MLLVRPDGALHIPPCRSRRRIQRAPEMPFIGAFAFHETSGYSLDAALRMAAAYAAFSVTRPGTQTSFAANDEFRRFLATIPLI